jgi:hypothetical protein
MGRLENFVTKPELAAALATLKAELIIMAEMSAMEMRLTKAMLRQTYAIRSAVVALAIGGAIARLIVHWFESRRDQALAFKTTPDPRQAHCGARARLPGSPNERKREGELPLNRANCFAAKAKTAQRTKRGVPHDRPISPKNLVVSQFEFQQRVEAVQKRRCVIGGWLASWQFSIVGFRRAC